MSAAFRFTKEAIEVLQPPTAGRAVYRDTKAAGLQLRVSAGGVKTFSVFRRTKGGSPERITIGRFPDVTVEQARRRAANVNAEIANGANPAQVKRALKAEPTLTEFFKEYGENHGAKKRTWRDDQQRFRDYLQRPLGDRKLSTIQRDMIGRVLTAMNHAGRANSTINNVRGLVSTIFTQAVEWGYLDENPVQGVKTLTPVTRKRFLLAHELPRFFAAVGAEANESIRDYFLLALLTGARRANVLAMRWTDVRLSEGTWSIDRTKNGEPQEVTLSPEAMVILTARKDAAQRDATFVFPGRGKRGHLVEPKRGWQRIFDRDELAQLSQRIEAAGATLTAEDERTTAESPVSALDRVRNLAKQLKINVEGARIQDLRIHDLRRTLGSWQAKTGASLAIIGKSLNHKSVQSTAIYARLDLDPVRQSVNVATAAMLEAAGLKQPIEALPTKAQQ